MPRWVLRGLEIGTYLMDFIDLSAILQGYAEHHDEFNHGKLVGKGVKILVQMYLENILNLLLN